MVTEERERTLGWSRSVNVGFGDENNYSQRWGHKRPTHSRRKGSYGTDKSLQYSTIFLGKTDAYATLPTRIYAIKAPAGPAVARTKPEFKKRPVPNVPAMAILHREP